MIWNMRRRKKKVNSKWYFNPQPSITRNRVYYANFTSNGLTFTTIKAYISTGLAYEGDKIVTAYMSELRRWSNRAYRTVVFDEAPTGDLLAFLQANATLL